MTHLDRRTIRCTVELQDSAAGCEAACQYDPLVKTTIGIENQGGRLLVAREEAGYCCIMGRGEDIILVLACDVPV